MNNRLIKTKYRVILNRNKTNIIPGYVFYIHFIHLFVLHISIFTQNYV